MVIASSLSKMGFDLLGISIFCVLAVTAALYLLFRPLRALFTNKVPCVGVGILLILATIITISEATNPGINNGSESNRIYNMWTIMVLLPMIPLMGIAPLIVDSDGGFFSGMFNAIKINFIVILAATALFDWLNITWIGYILLILTAVGIVYAWSYDDY